MALAEAHLKATIKNIGNSCWPTGGTDAGGAVRAGYYLFEGNNADDPPTGQSRPQLGAQDVRPGELTEASLELNAPREPGDYLLRLDLVAERINRFASFGSNVVRVPLLVKNC